MHHYLMVQNLAVYNVPYAISKVHWDSGECEWEIRGLLMGIYM